MANLEMFVALSLVADNFFRNIAKSSESLKEFEKVAKATDNASKLIKTTKSIEEVDQTAKKSLFTFQKLKNTIKNTFDPKQIKDFSEKLNDISEKFDDVALKAGTIGVGITGAFSKAINPAAEFEARLAEVSTLTNMSFEQFKKLYSSKLLAISTELGEDVSVVTKAFYDAISSGFSPEEALKVISQAGKAAIGGVSDIATANKTLITVAKVWADDNMTLGQISDYLFKTIAKGITTFPELARNIGGVASSIAAAGIKFKEFSAFVAAATSHGIDTNQTMTSLRAIVDSLVAPTGQAEKALAKLGLTINKETLQEKGLFGTLKMIKDRMNELGLSEAEQAKLIATIFGSVEARKVLNSFMKNTEKYEEFVKQFQSVGGETEQAFQKMNQGALDALQDLQNAFKNTAIVFGNLFLPVIGNIANKIGDFVIKLQEFIENHQTAAKWMGYVIGGLGIFATAVASSALALSFFLKTASFITATYGQILTPFVFVKDKITDIVVFSRNKWKDLQYIFNQRKGFTNWLDFQLLRIKYKFLDTVSSAKQLASVSFTNFLNTLQILPSKINQITLATYTWAKANLLTIAGLKNLSKSLMINLLNGLKSAIIGFRTLTLTMLTNPIFWIGATFTVVALLIFKYWKPIANFFKGIFIGIKQGLEPIIPAVKETAKAFAPLLSLFSPIVNFAKAIWNLIKPVDDTGNAALNMGIKFGKAIGKIISLILKIPLYLLKLPVEMFKAGQKIVESIIQGIKNKISAIAQTMSNLTKKIRNFLPFSPAKEGALSDIHLSGIKLIQTIAQGIKEDPLISKLQTVLSKAKGLLQLSPIGFLTKQITNIIAPKPIKPSSVNYSNKKATINITINPVINIQGTADKKTIEFAKMQLTGELKKEISKIIKDEMRLNYGL